jgi:hypothetical protein
MPRPTTEPTSVRSYRVPFGYRLTDESIYRAILRMLLQDMNAQQMADRLNDRGIKDPKANAPWTAETVLAFFRSHEPPT